MNGANHKVGGFSTYPFQIFGNGWEAVMPGPSELLPVCRKKLCGGREYDSGEFLGPRPREETCSRSGESLDLAAATRRMMKWLPE